MGRVWSEEYAAMNLRFSGIAGIIFGSLFRFLHWPGANIMLFAGALLTIVTLTILITTEPGPWTVHIQRPVRVFTSLAVALLGAIFQMMH